MQCNRLLAFLVFSVGKCFLKCRENSQHLLKEKERKMKSSRGSVIGSRAGKMELSCPLGIARCPFARHLKLNAMQSVGKCFLKCSENSQHLLKEKERKMKSSRGSVNFVLSYKFNDCDCKSVSCPVVSNLSEINFVKLVVHLCVKSSKKFINFPTVL